VTEAMGVSRSNLWDRMHGRQSGRPARYNKAEDERLLPGIRRVCGERGTYGYRRTAALLNRHREAAGLAGVNHKRVYRITRLRAASWSDTGGNRREPTRARS